MPTSKKTNPKQTTAGNKNDPKNNGLLELFTDCIRDMYWAEKHLLNALPKMQSSVTSKELSSAIGDHLAITKKHVSKLEKVFSIMKKEPIAKKCDAMEGITKEGECTIEETLPGSEARDIGVIFSSQKVEHYEIASYTGIIKLATILGLTEIADILTVSLEEEEQADNLLSEIADKIL